jgi:hypothetical protein
MTSSRDSRLITRVRPQELHVLCQAQTDRGFYSDASASMELTCGCLPVPHVGNGFWC